MELHEIYENTDYYFVPSPVKETLANITLVNFHRDRNGRMQTFYFTFVYNEKTYVLEHTFLYHGSGVKNWFKFKKSFLSRKPFYLSHLDLKRLSDELMKSVNKWNSQRESIS